MCFNHHLFIFCVKLIQGVFRQSHEMPLLRFSHVDRIATFVKLSGRIPVQQLELQTKASAVFGKLLHKLDERVANSNRPMGRLDVHVFQVQCTLARNGEKLDVAQRVADYWGSAIKLTNVTICIRDDIEIVNNACYELIAIRSIGAFTRSISFSRAHGMGIH